ncbi:hypothetical protein LB543_30915 [Mesorhizobium sp. ESP7-2]|uniref:hypothetical protein n=1 Tax=Mesorhizobium sp. ESP7-2 TaxID=2876622 RepID=UPI001CCE1CAE|nr:hypothetical protein [Mesorhizobium sp. ESP7-2]MBZ9711116.1 hypothetical protein [Mesorhizobium sp. ESP7-2]
MQHNTFNDLIRLSRRFAGLFITSVIALAVATAAGCSSIDYQKLTTGEISGSLFVMWVGEGNSSGDGNFLFVPDPHDLLVFHRAAPAAPGSTIKLKYTDGGSIPKIAQVFKGLSPWGYASLHGPRLDLHCASLHR